MNYKQHFIIGFLAGLCLSYVSNFSLFYILFWSLLTGLSALIPDLDHHNSKGTQFLQMGVILFALLLSWQLFSDILQIIGSTVIIYLVFIFIYKILKPRHRGITHTILATLLVLIISMFVFSFTLPQVLFIPLGYFSHLIADGVLKIK